MASPPACADPIERRRRAQWRRGSRTIKRSVVKGQGFPAGEALNPLVQEWLVTVADERLHGTTFRRPAEVFAEEHLRSHRERPPYVLHTSLLRTVARDCLVTVETNRYSVPAAYVGQTVEVQWGADATVQPIIKGLSSRPISGRVATTSAVWRRRTMPRSSRPPRRRAGARLRSPSG